jgi:predicted  nucleic acid-binding Zn-ribbon protein
MTAPAMEALLALQDLDATIDRMRHRLAALPERAELHGLATQAAALVASRAAVTAARDEVAAREQALEDELRAAEGRADEVDRRLYGGEVSASRDLQAMAADVSSLRARASELEDRALEVLEEREPLDAQVAELDAQLVALEASRSAVVARLETLEGEIGQELAEERRRRDEAASLVSPELLATYEPLRVRLGGVAVARLVGSRCDGCHLTLPATELDRLRRQPPDALVTCEQCGRILIRP